MFGTYIQRYRQRGEVNSGAGALMRGVAFIGRRRDITYFETNEIEEQVKAESQSPKSRSNLF